MLEFEYKGYRATADFLEEARRYEGKVTNLPDLIRFCGMSLEKTQKAFQDCVDVYIEICKKRGVRPHNPSLH